MARLGNIRAGEGNRELAQGATTEKKDGLLVLEPKRKTGTKRPPFFKVVMLNDDFTPMDFVVEMLKSVFRKDHHEAINTMLEIHNKGSGLCGVYTRDVAETKIDIVVSCARKNEFPLQCVMEPQE